METATITDSISAAVDGGVTMISSFTAPGDLPITDFADVGQVANAVFNGIEHKQWGLVASLAVLVIISLTRKFTAESTSKFAVWVNSKMGAIVLNFALSFGGAFATMFAAGQSLTLNMVARAFTVALTASGGWSLWKNFNEARAEKKAQAAGVAAAAKPEDTLNK